MATHTFSRQELYDLVWSEPMRKIAARFGLSDRGLAKACQRGQIPVPERGYWNKVQAGHKVKKSPLPPAKSDTPWRVTIEPPGPMPDPVPPAPPAPSIQELIKAEEKPEARVTVPATLSSPHRIVAAWIEEDRRKREERRRDPLLARIGGPQEKPELRNRKFRILSALFKAAEARAYKLAPGEAYQQQVLIQKGDVKLIVTVTERIRQFRRYLTEEEKAKNAYLTSTQTWTQEKEPTGELVLALNEESRYGLSKRWQDAPGTPLETQINAILGGIAAAFEEIRLRKEREAIEQKRRWEIEAQQRAREIEHKREIIRHKRLARHADDWDRAARIRAFVAAVETSERADADPVAFANWKSWALDHADQIDPLKGETLFDQEVTDMEVYSLR